MLNKEKHLESYCDIMKGFYIREDVLNYGKLIEEYFDNPPLKFEELKLYIPFWDKKENEWCYFTTLNNNGSGVKISINEFPYIQAFIFEENRFYRKQVE